MNRTTRHGPRDRKRATTDAVALLHARYVKGRPRMAALVAEAREAAEVARQIREMRNAAGLTQRQLAAKAKTTASVICRLEDEDYAGHSLAMLRRIAHALGQRVKVEFVPSDAA